tara:strand:+ start:219 stop:524 length:306 start_codon:yes stop_codon:yes gene_type:complete
MKGDNKMSLSQLSVPARAATPPRTITPSSALLSPRPSIGRDSSTYIITPDRKQQLIKDLDDCCFQDSSITQSQVRNVYHYFADSGEVAELKYVLITLVILP